MTAQITEAEWHNLIRTTPVIDGYELLSVLGEGRFGIVYKARKTAKGEFFAIKFLKVWSVPDHAQQNLIKRFELEFETGQIKSAYLIRSHHMNQFNGIPYFVMDFCSGGNLERRINQGITIPEALDIASKILTGLQDLHSHGKIHRDLKPENVLFDENGAPKLTDFGISGHINIQLTIVNNDDKPEQIFGSYAYMAPEQLSPLKRKNTLLPTIDIFSFGVVCYEMITGRLPFGKWESHEDIDPYIQKAARGDFDALDHQNVPVIWTNILSKCLIADREQRFQNIDEIKSLLNQKLYASYTAPCPPVFKVQVLDGEEYGKLYNVTLIRTALMGRRSSSAGNDVAIEETISNYISRRHATFELIDGNVYLRDGQWNEIQRKWVSSKNGTYVNGILIDSQSGHHLYCNDIITVGNTSIKIY